MDKAEARQIAAARIEELRSIPFPELTRRLLHSMETDEVEGSSGVRYQLEVQGFWDDRDQTNLRVMVSIDDGRRRAFVPITDEFIVAPDGSFIGE